MAIMEILADLTETERNKLVFWLVVLLFVVIAGFTIIMLLRRYIQEPLGSESQDAGFSLSELRAMRDRGEISPEEYEHTRARVIAAAKKVLTKKSGKPDRLSSRGLEAPASLMIPKKSRKRILPPPPQAPPHRRRPGRMNYRDHNRMFIPRQAAH